MSAFATLGGLPIVNARASFPRVGAWTAEVQVATEQVPTGQMLLTLGSGSFVGTVVRGVVHRAACYARLVGGAGLMGTELEPKSYHSAPVQVPLQDIATDAGETLAATSEAAVLRVLLPHWVRMAGTAGAALAQLLEAVAGSTWRFLPNGDLWVGTESWPKTAADQVELIDYEPLRDKVRFFSEQPGVQPGATFLGRKVSYVEHCVSEERLETVAWFEVAA